MKLINFEEKFYSLNSENKHMSSKWIPYKGNPFAIKIIKDPLSRA